MAQFSTLGIGRGQTFDADALSAAQKRGLQDGIDAAQARLFKRFGNIGVRQGSWDFAYDLGDYGVNFISRSTVARYGYGANTAIEATYPYSLVARSDE